MAVVGNGPPPTTSAPAAAGGGKRSSSHHQQPPGRVRREGVELELVRLFVPPGAAKACQWRLVARGYQGAGQITLAIVFILGPDFVKAFLDGLELRVLEDPSDKLLVYAEQHLVELGEQAFLLGR